MFELCNWLGRRSLLLVPFLATFLAAGSGDCGSSEPDEVYGCESDAECAAGQVCDYATGQCIVVDDGSGGDTGGGATCSGDGTTSGLASVHDRGDPTDAEQYLLEELNRTRADPHAEASRLGIELAEGTSPPLSGAPQQPLASNATLLQVAREHSTDMLSRNYFAHTNPDGLDPFDRMEAAGYQLRAAGENLFLGMSTNPISAESEAANGHDSLFVDEDYPGRGHRVAMLNPNVTEVGIGAAAGPYAAQGRMWNAVTFTQDFGAPADAVLPYLMGVVFWDHNGNGLYDVGEGLDGVQVELQGDSVIETWTDSAGGYAFAIHQDGLFAVTFSGGDLPSASCETIEINGLSRKLDIIVE